VRIAMAHVWLEHLVRVSGDIIHSGLGKFGKVATQRCDVCQQVCGIFRRWARLLFVLALALCHAERRHCGDVFSRTGS